MDDNTASVLITGIIMATIVLVIWVISRMD